MSLTFGSAFAGVGGFDLGLERAGLTCLFQVEIEAFCRRVLARHWPHVARHEDVRDVCGNLLRASDGRCAECGRAGWLPWVDVLCGGFPCQDLSIAGKRKGLKGERSGLFYEFTRIAAELRPTWVLLENVDGLLSAHDGEDFGLVLRELEDVGYVAGAWRVLDSRWFGVPQRRNRVFIVGCLRGSGRRPDAVLFESARGGWDSPTREKARPITARSAPGGAGVFSESGPGWWNSGVGALRAEGENRPSRPSTVVAHALSSSSTRTGRLDPNGETFIASALTSSMGHRGYGSPRGDANDNLVVGALGSNKDRGGWRCGLDEVAANHAIAVDLQNTAIAGDMTGALDTSRPTRGGGQALMVASGVRRLTPLECERLQGFPDGWTCLCGCQPYSTAACVCKDGPRYKALGNAVTVPVIEWIGRRLLEASS